jgi:putative two-component system response regulator
MTEAEGRAHRVVVVDEVLDRARDVGAALGSAGRRYVEAVATADEVDDRADAVLVRVAEDGGIETLRDLAALIERGVPVIALAAQDTRAMRRRALAAGARDFVTVGDNGIEDLELRLVNALDLRDVHAEMEEIASGLRRDLADTEQRLAELTRALASAHLDTLERLIVASEYRDDANIEHPQRVARTAALIGRQMGLTRDQVVRLAYAAQLHDVGKIGVPDEILLKPGRLDEDEFELMKTHTVIGWQILSGPRAPVLSTAAHIALSHHERFDGSGYPSGLKADDIPLPARITAVADVFDTLTHVRPYRGAFQVERALAEIRRLSHTQFDPRIVGAFELLDHEYLLSPVDPGYAEDFAGR